MKTKQNVFFGFAIFMVVAMFTLVGCDNGNEPGDTFVPVSDITYLPKLAEMDVNLELGGVVEPSNATNSNIVWSGNEVTNGVFKATSKGDKTVTATISKGKSESTPYTKTFTIKVLDKSDTSLHIQKVQAIWSKQARMSDGPLSADGLLIMKISGLAVEIVFEFTLGSEKQTRDYAKGFIIDATGSKYECQIVEFPRYHYESGTYSVTPDNPSPGANSKFTIVTSNPSDPVSGTWDWKSNL